MSRVVKLFLMLMVVTLASFAGKRCLDKEISKVRWAVELAGGMDVLASSYSWVLGSTDKLFMTSISVKKSSIALDATAREQTCTDQTDDCHTIALSILNALLLNQKYSLDLENLVLEFRDAKSKSIYGCEARYEITRTILATQYALSLPATRAQSVARALVQTIQFNGGIDFSLGTEACRVFFKERPFIAKAYLAHLALLMSIEKGRFSPGWLYLLSIPGVRKIIEGGDIHE